MRHLHHLGVRTQLTVQETKQCEHTGQCQPLYKSRVHWLLGSSRAPVPTTCTTGQHVEDIFIRVLIFSAECP